MLIDTQLLWSKYRRVFRIGALALAGLAALYIATPNLMRSREYSSVAALSDYVSESKAEMHRPSSPVQPG